jgi:hypothetical protein
MRGGMREMAVPHAVHRAVRRHRPVAHANHGRWLRSDVSPLGDRIVEWTA